MGGGAGHLRAAGASASLAGALAEAGGAEPPGLVKLVLAAGDRGASVRACAPDAGPAAVQRSIERTRGGVAGRFDLEIAGLDAAVADAGGDVGFRVPRQLQLDAAIGATELDARFRHLREADFDAAI